MPVFLSTYVNKVDKKGRVSVPAAFRTALAGQAWQGVVSLPSFVHPAIDACDMAFMEKLSSSQNQGIEAFGREQNGFAGAVFASARPLPFDTEGRIMLPDSLIAHASISESACFVGRGTTFQIWNPETFEAFDRDARKALETGGGQGSLGGAR